MANKYRVTLGYYDYEFDDRQTALDFAEMAFGAAVEDKTVKLTFIREQEGEENE